MPVAPLPIELLTLIFIFEHLYHLLCVDPRQDTLGVPQLASFVFYPFLFVNRNWHTLAKPFLCRHLPQELTERGLDGFGLRAAQPFVKSTTLRTDRVHWAASWATFVQPVTPILEQLRIEVVRPVMGQSLFPCLLPNLRLLRLETHEADARMDGQTALDLLHRLAAIGSHLEDLHLTLRLEGNMRLVRPRWTMSRLRRLHVYLSGGPDGFFEQVIVPCIVMPSAPVLQTFSLTVRGHFPNGNFCRLFPFPFPRLGTLFMEDTRSDWFSPDFWASLPNLHCAELPVASDPFHLPPPPASLQRLSLKVYKRYHLDALLSRLLSFSLSHLVSLGINGLAERSEDSEHERWKADAARLLARCEEDNIRFHSDFLGTFFPSSAFEELPPLAASHDLVVRYRGTPSHADEDEGFSGPSRSAGSVEDDFEWLPPASPGASSAQVEEEGAAGGGEDSDGSAEDSAEEYEDDWDAEELPLFRDRWSTDKRLAFDAERAFPNCTSLFASTEEFEAARLAAVEAMRPFLRASRESAEKEAIEVEE
ncbi:hypothetical protein JCM10213_003288 [Rhodosporidiobolus nylandii]